MSQCSSSRRSPKTSGSEPLSRLEDAWKRISPTPLDSCEGKVPEIELLSMKTVPSIRAAPSCDGSVPESLLWRATNERSSVFAVSCVGMVPRRSQSSILRRCSDLRLPSSVGRPLCRQRRSSHASGPSYGRPPGALDASVSVRSSASEPICVGTVPERRLLLSARSRNIEALTVLMCSSPICVGSVAESELPCRSRIMSRLKCEPSSVGMVPPSPLWPSSR